MFSFYHQIFLISAKKLFRLFFFLVRLYLRWFLFLLIKVLNFTHNIIAVAQGPIHARAHTAQTEGHAQEAQQGEGEEMERDGVHHEAREDAAERLE